MYYSILVLEENISLLNIFHFRNILGGHVVMVLIICYVQNLRHNSKLKLLINITGNTSPRFSSDSETNASKDDVRASKLYYRF